MSDALKDLVKQIQQSVNSFVPANMTASFPRIALDMVKFTSSQTMGAVSCLAMAVGYVGSMYYSKESSQFRNRPEVIKKRAKAVTLATFFNICLLYLTSTTTENGSRPFFDWIGLRVSGLLTATTLPLLLTMVLFLGPLAAEYTDTYLSPSFNPTFWTSHFSDWITIRNIIIAPITEEVTFRACMLPLLYSTWGPRASVFIAPLFFGVAHAHHLFENIYVEGLSVGTAVARLAFQFMYTSIFGAYSAFLYLRTGHVIAPVIAHAFCNTMGFPDFGVILRAQGARRVLLALAFPTGLVSFFFLLFRLTEPALYGNNVFAW